jgi:hypothetical protein
MELTNAYETFEGAAKTYCHKEKISLLTRTSYVKCACNDMLSRVIFKIVDENP